MITRKSGATMIGWTGHEYYDTCHAVVDHAHMGIKNWHAFIKGLGVLLYDEQIKKNLARAHNDGFLWPDFYRACCTASAA